MAIDKNIRIGTCGFRIAKEAYAQKLSSVEVQHTFYTPPSVATLRRWRAEVPSDFEFTLKAWQLITHESTSPTYRRLKKDLSAKEQKLVGGFRWTTVVKEAWATTLESARALNAKTVLFQCPAKFGPTKVNIRRMTKFFSAVKREGLSFAWEPRGPEWTIETVGGICRELDLWHAVDPFTQQSTTPTKCYFRMHGRVRWRYMYDLTELEELATLLPENGHAYVYFNNISMIDDAISFQRIVDETT